VNAAVRLLGSRAASGCVAAATRRRLRAVAYHVIDDPAAFTAQLDWFGEAGYQTVTGSRIAAALRDEADLPDRPLWITFDDGDPSVVRTALPLLRERGLVATAFLCGGWIGTDLVPWWTAMEAAVAAGVVRSDDLLDRADPQDLVSVRRAMKRSPDAFRRATIDRWTQRLDDHGTPIAAEQWSVEDLAAWLDAGYDVGNHSWDHPCLDRCDDEEQRRQIRLAHERLSELVGRPIDVFAWPNGDSSGAALDELLRLGYRLVADCDHRLVARRPVNTSVSRLRLDASADVVRTRAIVSGAHPTVFHLQQRVVRRGDSHSVT
jgi:peptidoglycan/xylan/chitin deacetylase (PgdA/CDA1 family)